MIFGREFEKQNDLYILNSAWFVFTSVTPGAGGNVLAATHFGRSVAAVAVICGVIIACVTTAALGNLMLFSPNEHTAMTIMEREKSRQVLRIFASNMIALWWRRLRCPGKVTKRQRKMDLYGYRRAFVNAQQMLQVEVEQCSSVSTKIEQISSRTRYMSDCIDHIGINLFSQKLSRKKRSPKHSPRHRSIGMGQTKSRHTTLSRMRSDNSQDSRMSD